MQPTEVKKPKSSKDIFVKGVINKRLKLKKGESKNNNASLKPALLIIYYLLENIRVMVASLSIK